MEKRRSERRARGACVPRREQALVKGGATRPGRAVRSCEWADDERAHEGMALETATPGNPQRLSTFLQAFLIHFGLL